MALSSLACSSCFQIWQENFFRRTLSPFHAQKFPSSYYQRSEFCLVVLFSLLWNFFCWSFSGTNNSSLLETHFNIPFNITGRTALVDLAGLFDRSLHQYLLYFSNGKHCLKRCMHFVVLAKVGSKLHFELSFVRIG